MNRRGFFATIAAAIVARKLPARVRIVKHAQVGPSEYVFGWTGFSYVNGPPYICGSNVLVPTPRTAFKLTPPEGGF